MGQKGTDRPRKSIRFRTDKLVCPTALLLLVSVSAGQQAEIDKIRNIIRTYEKSIGAADTALASEIWSTTADVSFIHPLGHEHGWEQIKRNVYEKLMRDLFSERQLTARDIEVHVYQDAAWAEFNWVFTAKQRSDGKAVKTEGRETQVYRKTDSGWRIVHVHYSAMPGTQ